MKPAWLLARADGSRRRIGIVAALTAALVTACGQPVWAPREELRFPRPDRPVAPVVSPTYSDEATRDARGEAERVMDRLGIRPGVRVADIGAGEGYYTVRLARRLGPSATIYATDVDTGYLNELEARLAREGISGVTLVLGAPRDPKLPEASVDVAILGRMYHHIENPYEFLYRLQPALAPGSRIGIVDVERPTQHHGTPPALLRCELAAVGYREVEVRQGPPSGSMRPCETRA